LGWLRLFLFLKNIFNWKFVSLKFQQALKAGGANHLTYPPLEILKNLARQYLGFLRLDTPVPRLDDGLALYVYACFSDLNLLQFSQHRKTQRPEGQIHSHQRMTYE
jgi:hypothetical protein